MKPSLSNGNFVKTINGIEIHTENKSKFTHTHTHCWWCSTRQLFAMWIRMSKIFGCLYRFETKLTDRQSLFKRVQFMFGLWLCANMWIVDFVKYEYWIEMGINTFRVWFTTHKSCSKLRPSMISDTSFKRTTNLTLVARSFNDPLSHLSWVDNRYWLCVFYENWLQAFGSISKSDIIST